MEKVKTAVAALFLIAFAGALTWGAGSSIAACVFGAGRCAQNEKDISSAVLGFAFLGLVIWLGSKLRR